MDEERAEGWVLLDMGMLRLAHADPESTSVYQAGCEGALNYGEGWHLYPEPPVDAYICGKGGTPLEAALAEVGLAPADIAWAGISHMHVNHSGGIPTLASAGVPIAIQARELELELVRSGAVGVAEGFHEPDWTEPGTDPRIFHGEEELAPGVSALDTPGHTPGHQSFRVDLPDTGTWIPSGDAADLAQNSLDRVPCDSYAGGTDRDEQMAGASLEKLLDAARETNAHLIPGHDQLVLNAVRHRRRGHR